MEGKSGKRVEKNEKSSDNDDYGKEQNKIEGRRHKAGKRRGIKRILTNIKEY